MEMTIEEKAKAYDIAVKKLTTLFGSGDTCTREEIEHVFPELAESGDEEIRKELIDYINSEYCHTLDLDRKNRFIAWLEKKGDQKLEPKFEIGDTIRNKKNGETFTIVVRSILTQYYSNEDHTIEINFSEQDGWELVKPISAEWSEEDELNLSEALHHIRMYNLANKADKLDKWLKSIKNRIQSKQTWKPSKKQMKDLAFVADQNKGNMVGKTMISLYYDLSKFKLE